ncbi:MAG TPA: ribosome maturation factor RimP [Candidatus Desulfobacillus sp.]|nr:ribosome maturation factor RimP [Candidatus Desulfobacillus sp.]
MAELLKIVEQAVTGLGYELVDFEASPRARLLRVFIDAPGGVSIEDCTRASNHLTRLFAVEDIDYDRLEVSSPGLDRPLKKAADFARFAGQEANVRLRLAVNGQRNFTGVLGGVADGRLRLVCGGETHEFALDQVDKARLVPHYEF